MQQDSLTARIARARTGDEVAVAALISEFGIEIRQACETIDIGTAADLSYSDLTQEAWIRIWSHLGSFQGGKDDESTLKMFRSWIKTTARNVMLNLVKRAGATKRGDPTQTRKDAELCEEPDGLTPSDVFAMNESSAAVHKAIESLPSDERYVVERCFFDGVPLTEVARERGRSYDQIRTEFSRALGKLKTFLPDDLS